MNFNDLANKASSTHTHSNYVTSSQVATIVNQNISNGVITVGSVFKSINKYSCNVNNNPKLKITGPGIFQPTQYNYAGLRIDGEKVSITPALYSLILFNSSIEIDMTNANASYYIKGTIGIFN